MGLPWLANTCPLGIAAAALPSPPACQACAAKGEVRLTVGRPMLIERSTCSALLPLLLALRLLRLLRLLWLGLSAP